MKLPLNDLGSFHENTAITTINDNNAKIEAALENTLSRDGTAPNQMGAPLDMNSNRILNLPAPQSGVEPLRKVDVDSYVFTNNGTATIAIGAVSTLTPASPATVTNVGTAYNQVLNFGIPRGATGAPGTDGTNGINGTNGTGTVNGPATSVVGNIALWNATDGKLLKDSGVAYTTPGVVMATDYASGSIASTTGSISSGSSTLTLSTALDFKNGQSIRINGAGSAASTTAPTSTAATTVGTAGSTTYTYSIVAFNATGGFAAPTANFAVTTGNATLSMTNYVSLTWSGATNAVGYAIYGRAAGSLTLIGYTNGTRFFDYGAGSYYIVNAVDWLTSTLPAGAGNNWLVTTIVSGAGTTSLTLFTTATSAASSKFVCHDDTTALQTALTAAKAAGRALDLSGGGFRISAAMSITAPIEIKGSFGGNSASSAILLSSPVQNGISITGGNYANLHDFSMWGNGAAGAPQMSGAGILIANSGGHTLRNINMNQMWQAFNISGGPYYISGNLISGYGEVIYVPTFGDSGIINNSISPIHIPGNNAGNAIGMSINGNPGGSKIIGNKINSAILGYIAAISINVGFNDADILISNNSFEGWSFYAVLVDRVGSFNFGNIQIIGNQFSGGHDASVTPRAVYSPSTANWVNIINISNNLIYCAGEAINWQGGQWASIAGNIIQAGTGINLGSGMVNCSIGMNNFTNSSIQIASANAQLYAAVTTTKPAY